MIEIIPENGQLISQDVSLRPGTYYLPDGLTIAASQITVEGNGAVLIGEKCSGRGLSLRGQHHVTIQNVGLQGYYHGLYADDCHHLTIDHCQVRQTAEVAANSQFLNIWLPAGQAYGGGILLHRVQHSRLSHNDLQHQMNGLLTYHCHQLSVTENLANYCSGFGFHLYDTSYSQFEANYADYCCRYEPRGVSHGHLGADAAGFVLVYGSSHNVFRGNYARLGGDGFFVAGLPPGATRPVGCDNNLFEENDGSYSPNIAFEATFCQGNTFRNNKANHCNYGFWLGFSHDNLLENNGLVGNRQAGIGVENGFDMIVHRNQFRHNQHAILLWSKYVADFAQAVPENDTSRDWLIEENEFNNNWVGIRIAANQDHGLRPLPAGTPPTPRPHHHTIRHNQLHNNRLAIELGQTDNTDLDNNDLNGNGLNLKQW